MCPRLNKIVNTFRSKKLRKNWSIKWGKCREGMRDTADALADVFWANKATLGLPGARFIVVDSNESCAMPLTDNVLTLCTASGKCSGWKSILYLTAHEKLINSEARKERSSLHHTTFRTYNVSKLLAT